MTLTDFDRLWRDQNVPNVSDGDFEKILDVSVGNVNSKSPLDESELATTKTEQNNTNNNHKAGETVYKFSNRGRGQLREAVNINGEACLIKYNQEKGIIEVEPRITNASRILRPPNTEEYPYNPYEFKSLDEAQKYLSLAMDETPDSLLAKINTEVKKFNEIEKKTATLLSINILGSYFQDRFSTVHYLNVVGANGTGKSSFGDTFECLGYRPVNITNTTEAFWFRIFGTVEYGQVTIIVEEFDKMDENSQIMAMLKVGYQPNAKVLE